MVASHAPALPRFLTPPPAATLADIAAATGVELVDATHADRPIRGLAALDAAGPRHIAFCDQQKYADRLSATQAGACFVTAKLEARLPANTAALRTAAPYRAFVALSRLWHAEVLRPKAGFCHAPQGSDFIAATAYLDPTAKLEDGVVIEPMAVIGPGVDIGAGTVIGAGAQIAANVRIGRNCAIGAGATIAFAFIGNDVIVHPGVRIGQDGYGFAQERGRHIKIPQIGRVIIQHDVEIGANSTIDRGALGDTVIGEGTKIDNLVQIGHNVTVGRRCIIVSQCGLAGSSVIGDGVVLGARVGVSDHAEIGEGAQVAARASVLGSLPAGGRFGGAPAKPIKQFFRELFEVERLGREGRRGVASQDAGIAPAKDGE